MSFVVVEEKSGLLVGANWKNRPIKSDPMRAFETFAGFNTEQEAVVAARELAFSQNVPYAVYKKVGETGLPLEKLVEYEETK